MLPAPSIANLKEVKPLIGKSLESTTEDYIDDMFLYFELTDKIGDGEEVSTTPLKEGGKDIMVTRSNREEYKKLVINHYMNNAVDAEFNSFLYMGLAKRVREAKFCHHYILRSCTVSWEAMPRSTGISSGPEEWTMAHHFTRTTSWCWRFKIWWQG